jgi:hypothetical protein
MLTLLKTKVALVLIGTLVAGSLTGTAVMMAQNHAGPFHVSGQNTNAGETTKTPESHEGDTYHAQGLIKGVTFASNKASGSLTFLPNGATTTVTVHFTAQTHIEVAGDRDHEDADEAHSTSGQPGAAGLKAGLFAAVEGTRQSDGSVLAKEIQANANGNAHHNGDEATPEAGDDHDADDAHGTATPTTGD